MSTVDGGATAVTATVVVGAVVVVASVSTFDVESRERSYATVIVMPARVERDDRAEPGRDHRCNLVAPIVAK